MMHTDFLTGFRQKQDSYRRHFLSLALQEHLMSEHLQSVKTFDSQLNSFYPFFYVWVPFYENQCLSTSLRLYTVTVLLQFISLPSLTASQRAWPGWFLRRHPVVFVRLSWSVVVDTVNKFVSSRLQHNNPQHKLNPSLWEHLSHPVSFVLRPYFWQLTIKWNKKPHS